MSNFGNNLHRLQTLSGYQLGSDLRLSKIRVKLDANENWHIPEKAMHKLLRRAIDSVDPRAYPLGIVDKLRTSLANHLRIPAESIVPTQGADQGIGILCEAFLRQNTRVLIIEPTFPLYKLRASIAGAECIGVSMNNDLSLPVERILNEGADAAVVFICSPNNPTANQFAPSDIIQVCDRFSGLVVLDEAYVDFAKDSLVHEITRRRNLVVLRTFSKAFGLANLRLGFIIANPEWAPLILDRVQYPYPLSSLVAALAVQLLENFTLVKKSVESLRNERAWLLEQLRRIDGVKTLDSQTNFILTSLPIDVAEAHRQLLEHGIATKKIGQILDLPNCIRVTVGTRKMNLLFLESLREVLNCA